MGETEKSDTLDAFPFGQDFQKKLLAILIRSGKHISAYAGSLEPEYFTYEHYQIIWKLASEYYLTSLCLPSRTAFSEEFRKYFTDDYTREFYNIEIDELLDTAIEDENYILGQLDDFLRFQKLRRILLKATDKLSKKSLDFSDLMDMIRESMALGRKEDVVNYKEFGIRKSDEKVEYIETGYTRLDFALKGGLGRGMLGVIAAYTGVGKTMWLANVAYNALKRGRKTLYISLEQSVREIATRIDMVYAVDRGLSGDGLSIKKEMLDELPGELYMKDYPPKRLKVSELSSFIYKLNMTYGFKPDIVIVDYGALMRGTGRKEGRWEEIGGIYEDLRGLAVEHNVALWTAAQIHREAVRIKYSQRTQVKPSALIYYTRDSSIIAEVSDRFLILSFAGKNYDYDKESIKDYTITLAKTRTGSEGLTINFIRNFQRLEEEIAPLPPEEEAVEIPDNML